MNDIDPVLRRLSDADPAQAAAETMPADSWTVLIDTIGERNGIMSSISTTPWWRSGPAIAAVVFALMIGAVAIFMSVRPTELPEVAEPTTTTQSALTTVTPATTTPLTSAAVTAAPAVSGVELPGPGEPWDVLIIAHGRRLGEAFPQMYVERAEQQLGVQVNLHYNEGIHGYAPTVLRHMGGGGYPDLSDQIKQAEIILLQTWPAEVDDDAETPINAAGQTCSSSISTADPQPPAPTSAEDWQPYRDVLNAIYTEIWALREGTPTLLVSLDHHNEYLRQQRETGIEPECRAWYEAVSATAAEAAADHGAMMVSVYDSLNGPNHDIDPVEMGFLGPTEQTPALLWRTPNEIGAAVVVDAIAAVGFEPLPMP